MPNKQITDEMVEAGAKALGGDDWITCVHDRPMWRREAKEVLEAAAPQPSGPVEALKRIAQLKEVRRGGGVFDYEPALSAMEMYEIAFDALTAGKPGAALNKESQNDE